MSLDRLQKIIAGAGLCSRREAEAWIEEGRVFVNGRLAILGQKASLEADSIRVDGKVLRPEGTGSPRRYILLNKPKGYVSTTNDPQGRPTVLDLVAPGLRKGLKPVGRLDTASEGLILLTDDGDFAQKVAHPSHGVGKTYRVKIWGEPPEKSVERLRRGILIEGRRTARAEIERHHSTARRGEEGNTWYTVVLHEGRSRQIRRMFEAIGHPVSKLKRVAIGSLRDEKLPAGGYRKLTEGEIVRLTSPPKAPRGTDSPRREPRAAFPRSHSPGPAGPRGSGRDAPNRRDAKPGTRPPRPSRPDERRPAGKRR